MDCDGSEYMVVDCFTFFNELELLELRCEELLGKVDCHFLIESPTTFAGKEKPLLYVKNALRFRKYPIMPLVVELPFKGDLDRNQAWSNDHSSRILGYEQVASHLQDDDIVLLSDVDEIPRGSRIMDSPEEEIVTFNMRTYTYWLNYQSPEVWVGTSRMSVKKLKELGGQQAYHAGWHHGIRLDDAGWHFSYQGGIRRIQDKLRSAAHIEYGGEFYTNPVRMAEKFKDGSDLFDRDKDGFHEVPIDDSYPVYLREHPERFPGMICS